MKSQIIELLKLGRIGVMPTDTIYGIVGSALNPDTVEAVYKLRKRSGNKPFIILISSMDDLQSFGIKLTKQQVDFLQKNWPNPLSVILPLNSEKYNYLHRGKNSLAFRMPKDEKLLELLKQTGPLVAPSANYEGERPAETIDEAKRYFGDRVDLYIDGGNITEKSSTIIQLFEDGSKIVLRKGSYKI
ncbi:MAG: L-threonylcarbamoyladenylate synthase [Candidatus Daviesbacteria bacterium]|nr:L-threonylcarbamoyladenylate synthase [Candidatus Daviesbacteria bacterium]